MLRNVSGQKVTLYAVDTSTGLPKSGDAANITAYVSKDDGVVTVLTDTTATESDATNAQGDYLFDVSQTESDAAKLRFTGKSSTPNVIVVPQTIYTLPTTGLLAPTVTGRTLDVTVNGNAGIDWGNVENPLTVVSLDNTVIATITNVTNPVTVGTNSDKTGYSLASFVQAYPADGATTITPDEMFFSLLQNLTEFAIVGSTLTVKKRDGSTTAEVYTLNSPSNPTSRTRTG